MGGMQRTYAAIGLPFRYTILEALTLRLVSEFLPDPTIEAAEECSHRPVNLAESHLRKSRVDGRVRTREVRLDWRLRETHTRRIGSRIGLSYLPGTGSELREDEGT